MAITASVPNDEARDSRRFERIERTVRENQASIAETVKPIVSDLGRTIEEKLATGYYTREQADAAMAARVAAPGAIAPTTVSASGAVSSATTISATGGGSFGGTLSAGGRLTANAGMTSTGVRSNQVTVGYVAMYVDQDGNFGYAPSTMSTKSLLRNFSADLEHWLTLIPKVFAYKGDPDRVEQLGLVAELVVKREPMLGIYDEAYKLRGVRYELLGVVCLALIQAHVAETRAFRDDITRRLAALEAAA
ncbi:hypothetical protein [Frigoribacterium sp. MCBA15_019]|uniref:hypothetical protein n=1 Tax=Frigoribacterium sp. MCBA15_019 TaxID=1898745 RepID=UPI0008DE474E|nr:hypothetical protein [Frigoribacterium sp. MCBA15_019]OII27562.1 hypothetical protein BIV04_03230 [Frigoribacterium sp. MCBA15_019]